MKRHSNRRPNNSLAYLVLAALTAGLIFAALGIDQKPVSAAAGLADPIETMYRRSAPNFDLNESLNAAPLRQATGEQLAHLDTGKPLAEAGVQPVAANAYLGGWGIVQALDAGADIVSVVTDITLNPDPEGRCREWIAATRPETQSAAAEAVAGHSHVAAEMVLVSVEAGEALALVGVAAQLGLIYWIGWLAICAILSWEHRIVRPDDLSRINRAFFDFNAYVSIGYFLATLADVFVTHGAIGIA